MTKILPDKNGHFGIFGGRYAAETLMPALIELERAYQSAQKDKSFQKEFEWYQREYAGRVTPLYYAQRTVDIASARLWLIEGVPMEDVVTMLEFRRRFEIPAALCSARAREIAQTAQRMIARRKIA